MQKKNLALSFGLATVMSFALTMPHAMAAESIISPEPVGGTDLNQALLPPPGFYGALAALPLAYAPNITDTYGHTLPYAENLDVSAFIGAIGGLYVYPWQVFGGSLATSLQASAWSLQLSPHAAPAPINHAGFGDIYSDAFYWSKNVGLFGVTPGESKHIPYGLTIAGGFAFKAPTGQYNPVAFGNIGSNLWIMVPNLAVTYNTGPNWSLGDSTQLSARLFMAFPLTNPTTNYTSGNVLDVDWAISEIFGNWQVGLSGYYVYQYTNDYGVNNVTGVSCPSITCIDGNRSGAMALGPVIQYTFPDSGVAIKAKYNQEVWDKNHLVQRELTLEIAMKLF